MSFLYLLKTEDVIWRCHCFRVVGIGFDKLSQRQKASNFSTNTIIMLLSIFPHLLYLFSLCRCCMKCGTTNYKMQIVFFCDICIIPFNAKQHIKAKRVDFLMRGAKNHGDVIPSRYHWSEHSKCHWHEKYALPSSMCILNLWCTF